MSEKIADELHAFIAAAPHKYPGHLIELFDRAEKALRRCSADSADDLRSAGWMVAVHNDYRLNGKPHTFWLFTKGDRAIKGEGDTDQKALDQCRALAGAEPQTVSKLEAEIGMLREKLSDALASGLPHKSDCAVYSAPAHEPGPCDCGVGASFDDGAFDLALKLRQHNGWVRVVSDTDAVNLIKSFIASRCQADSSPQSAPSDDLEDLVARFSKALLAKLKLARANGRSGWEFDDWEEHCQAGLLRHLAKGDPRDVAAYCAFMWHHGWATKAADRQSQAESAALTQSERKL
jgi:hypothetical protein